MRKDTKLNIDQLLLYSLSQLIEKGEQSTFENLVVSCFKLFPQEFSLKGFINKYPDSSRIDKTWRRCRTDRDCIAGSVGHGFIITTEGNKELINIEKQLKNNFKLQKNEKLQKGDKRTKSGRIVEHIEKHPSYLIFQKNKDNASITDYLICDLLFSTLDSFPESRKKNLLEMKKFISVYKRNDLLKFLEWIENSKKHLLKNN